jgi:hypothetical protein
MPGWRLMLTCVDADVLCRLLEVRHIGLHATQAQDLAGNQVAGKHHHL